METFDGNIQINHYDAEGLRAEMEENGRLATFIFNPAKEVVTETEDRTVLRYIRDSELIARNTDVVEGNILNRYEYGTWGSIKNKGIHISVNAFTPNAWLLALNASFTVLLLYTI